VVNSYRGDGESNQSGMLYALDPDTKTATVCGFSGYGYRPIFKETVTYDGTNYQVTSIAESAFEGSWISELFPIPASITTIGANAFKNCADLNTIQIRNTVTSIGQGAFDGWRSYFWIVDETYLYYTIDKSTNTAAAKGFKDGGSSTDVEVPESIKIDQIGEFQITSVDTDARWESATSVKLPSTVTSIGDYGFAKSSSLTSIEIPTTVTSIGKGAFAYSEALTSITIPEGVTTIGEGAFKQCTALESISFPSTLTSLGTQPFDDCSSLDTVTFAGPILTECSEYYYNCNKFTAVLSNGLCLSLRKSWDYWFNVTGFSGTGTEATVPTKFLGVDVRNVESMTLSDNAAVTSITVPSSITINKDAFSNCGKLRLVNGDYSYKLNEGDKTLTFTIASYNGSAADVTLPSSAWGFAVTAVGEKAFEDKTSITNVTIPSSITSIEAYAFSGCTGLTSIDIPSTVATVGDYAFNNCTGITSKSYDASTTILGENVFAGNTEMSSHEDTSTGLVCSVNTASKSVAVTGYLGTAESLTVPTGITYNGETYSIVAINAGAFKDASVTSIVIPQTVKVFPGAFDYDKTTALADDNSMTYALNDADKTASVTGYSGSSTGVVIPVSIWGYDVTAINSNAFGENTTMTSITVPSAVPSFASGTFDSCSNLTTYKDENGFSYSLSDGAASVTGYSGSATEVEIPGTIWSNTVTSIASSVFKSKSTITSVKIPESVTSIGSSAFSGCSALASVNIPEKVTSISAYLFNGCIKLSSVSIPEDVTIIGNYAFCGCKMLSSIKIPSTVGTIGTYAFATTGLTSIEIPSSVTSLSDYLFSNCDSLQSVSIPETVTSIGKYVFRNCSKLTNEILVIPSSVTSMGDGVFYGCTGLTDIILLSGASKVESEMFYGCTGLTKVTIPNGVTSIGSSAFYQCTGLTEVIIPDGVTSIGSYAFRECTGLQKINIPSSVTSLGSYVFGSCSKLEDVDLPSSVTSIGEYAFSGAGITKIVLPPGATKIVNNMFSYCKALKSLDFPETVTTIGNRAFGGCTGLTEVDLPSTVKNLGNYVFSGCTNLKDVTIRSSKITFTTRDAGGSMFENCSKLETITCYAEAAPSFSSNIFIFSFPKDHSLKIRVPAASAYSYKHTMPWEGTMVNGSTYTTLSYTQEYLSNYPRSTAKGKFGTICLPYDYVPEGAVLYTVDTEKGLDGEKVYLTEVTRGEAGKAYIYRATERSQNFPTTLTGDDLAALATTEPVEETDVLSGSKYDGTTYAPADSYVLQTQDGEQAFYKVESDKTISILPHRAYLTTSSSNAAALRIGLSDEEGTPTAVDAIRSLTSDNPVIYDLNGRRLQTLQKGINIVNGVKVYVK
jgi:hypothetical protein